MNIVAKAIVESKLPIRRKWTHSEQ